MTLTTNEVACLTDLSLRQLQWLDEQGIISPRVKGSSSRAYTETDLLEAMIVAKLRAKKIGLKRARKVLAYLRQDPLRMVPGAYVIVDRSGRVWTENKASAICTRLSDLAGPAVLIIIPAVPEVNYPAYSSYSSASSS